ncbi:hypothetical protein CONCODRAFT_77085 [Conidiobolus coronatus NRRL 28638]|uniref:Pentacotripeptide-repeat region of PRORP domain-containing protein n=1 Tax=Conidiobolus coronatus (strain ATCC 28846 / CBS 209.66 / NRRL 28638) TaxID=796925 RepID=A0A137PG10_CONC2|nr:hypothetical protein CONCODRAFT_77085 [Conidiobolus coronatus NRRL 28638]|eukprot:KXN73934.1 hypothetical protein CONCODRAFT_77085 [Conidiobolus coronatus NRRL 28638]
MTTDIDEIAKLYLSWKNSGDYIKVVEHYTEATRLNIISDQEVSYSKSYILLMNIVLQCGWLSGQGEWSWNLFLNLFSKSEIDPDIVTISIMAKGLYGSDLHSKLDHLLVHLKPTFHLEPNLVLQSYHIRSLLLRGGKKFQQGMHKLHTILTSTNDQKLSIKFIGTMQKQMIEMNRLKEAFILLNIARRRGLQPITPLINQMLLCGFTSGKSDFSQNIYTHYFNEISTPDEISLTTMAYGMFKAKKYTESRDYLNQMQNLGMTDEKSCEKIFNHMSYQLLLNPPTSPLHTAASEMLDFIMKNFQYPKNSKVINMYNLIHEEIIVPSIKFNREKQSYNLRVDRLKPFVIRKLPQIFNELQEDLPKLTQVYSCVFVLFSKYGTLNQCKELFELVKDQNSLITPHMLSCLLSRAFNEKDEIFINQLIPLITTFNLPLYHVIICGYKGIKQPHNVYKYFYQMIEAGYLPSFSITRSVMVMLLREARINDLNKLAMRLDKIYNANLLNLPDEFDCKDKFYKDEWKKIQNYLKSLQRRGVQINQNLI